MSGNQFFTQQMTVATLSDGRRVVGGTPLSPSCAWEEAGLCGTSEDFSPDTVASMTVRLPDQLGGWIFGRLQNPSINVSPFDTSTDELTISASSVTVPTLEVTSSYPNMTPGFQTFVKQNEKFFSGVSGGSLLLADPPPFWAAAFWAVDDLRSGANNTATATRNVWSFNSTEDRVGNGCMTSRTSIDGMVTTNAMAYTDAIPNFVNGFLDEDVAGMHYLSGGTLALGTYDLVMADSVAQCLYGFTKSPISATVSITDSAGQQNIATKIVTDHDGWLHVGAYGFTFSNPVIRVHLTGHTKSSTIECQSMRNPAAKKKVHGDDPRCPVGFKKVRA